jgi:hypothetical protein
MRHLEDNSFVHRNLSARNVMFMSDDYCVKITDADNCVKVSDAGLESNQCDLMLNYYCKWMSLETLQRGITMWQ